MPTKKIARAGSTYVDPRTGKTVVRDAHEATVRVADGAAPGTSPTDLKALGDPYADAARPHPAPNARIKGEQFERLVDAVAPLDTPEHRERYLAGDFPRADAVKDLDKRYRWDLFWAGGNNEWIMQAYHDGLDDTHVDSALRSIVPPLR